jgi:heat induced stress protein YflT
MSTLVTGIFTSRAAAERGVQELIDFGYSRDDISVLMTDTTRGREFAVKDATKAPEGAATGAAVGGVLGALAAGLVAVGTIVVPGLGLAAAGPVVASLAGLGAGAAAGGLIGALTGLGIPEHEARFYHDEIKKGGILVGVYAHKDRVRETKEILEAAGAEKVHS